MPENPKLPSPNQVLGTNNASRLPSPEETLNFKSPKLREGDASVILPKYKTPKELEVDSAVNFIKEKGGRNGSTIMDSELDVLRDVLKDPRVTEEQRKKAILTIQGYDSKHDDNNTMYYNKREDNGVYIPTALAYGERPPQGYKTASIWGNKKEAEDDSWYTDLGKSLANGVLGAVGGVFDVAQVGQELVTGSESKYLNKLKNTTEALKFEKDSDLEKPIYNTEGIQTFGDLLDKDRFDLSPQALWGTFNMAAESLTGFGTGVKGASILAKGGKGFIEGLKGIEGAVELGKSAQKAAIFTGSFASQVGDVYDSATETGLKGRDRAALATSVGGTMAALDAFWGLDGKIMSNMFKKSKKEMLQNLIKTVERDELGNITEQGFKELAKQTTVQYAQLAKNGAKEIVKDAISEGGQEAAQDFSQKAGEELWDKLSDEDKAKFGTNATSAESFGDYINSFATGLVSGAPMAVVSQTLKNQHDEQSINAYERVKEGDSAVMALKTDLVQSLKAGEITQSEFNQANFKIDSYKKFNKETKGLNLDSEKERKAFELSFQIEGLKTEIPTTPKELDKLAPIPLAAVKSKQDEVNNLQKELTELVGKAQAKAEPLVSKKTQEKVVKETEEQATENKKEIVSNLKQKKATNSKWEYLIDNSVNERELDAVLDQMDKVGETTPDLSDYVGLKRIDLKTPKTSVSKPVKRALKRPKETTKKSVKEKSKFTYIPYKEDKRAYSEIPNDEFNSDTMDDRKKHASIRKELSTEIKNADGTTTLKYPEGKFNGTIVPRTRTYEGEDIVTYEFEGEDGKKIRFASSKLNEAGFRSHMRTERLHGNAKGLPTYLKMVDLGKIPEDSNYKIPEGYTSKKKVLGIYQASDGAFLGWAKETHKGDSAALDKNGNPLYNSDESNAIKHVETKVGKPLPPEEIAKLREPKTPIEPTETKVVEVKQEVKPKENGKQKSAVNGEKPARGNNEETNGESESTSKELKLPKVKQNKDRESRGIKDPFRKKAADFDPANAYESVLTYFAGKGFVSMDSLRKFFKETKKYSLEEWKKTNTFKRQNITKKGAPTIDEVANSLWENQSDRLSNLTTEDYKDAIEEVLRTHTSPIDMSKELLKNNGIDVDLTRLEEISMNAYETADKEGYTEELNTVVDYLEGKTDEELKALAEKDKWEEGTDIIVNNENEPFQKVSQRKGDFSKVLKVIQNAFKGINVVEDASKFTGDQYTVAGKVSADGKNIYLNPNYSGLDTPIHEAGHVLIDAMGYNNKIIQAAIKQLRTTTLYAETRELYKELNEEELDKEVLAEAIGREGADIFDKEADKSKFKGYLEYIFDWLKRKLGLEKNVAKNLAKQIIKGIGTKNLEGTKTGKEQLSKKSSSKFTSKPLSFQQYADENGFSAEKENEKIKDAKEILDEAEYERGLAKKDAEDALTDAEVEKAEAILKEKTEIFNKAYSNYKKIGKRKFDYNKYNKDFKEIQSILKEKDLDDYSAQELNDLIAKLFSFNDKAAKAVREKAYQRLGHKVTVKQQEVSKGFEGVIESLAKTSDISPLQSKILHYSQFSEKNVDMQALGLANGKAIIEKLSEANSLKETHAKLGLKVIREENKRLGITGMAMNRFSSDSSKYFEYMINEKGEYLTVKEAEAKGLSEAKINYLKFHREIVDSYRNEMDANDFENIKMAAIRVDKNFMEAYKSEGLLPAFSYYLGGGATNLGKVRIVYNGQIMSYAEIEKDIISKVDKKSIQSISKALFDLLVANIKARYQLKKGQNVDEKENPLELKGEAEYSLNEKGRLVSKFDKPRAKDRGYSKDFYKAMNQFIDESAHVKHISKIMPLVEAIEYLNKNGYMEEGYAIKPNVAKWIEDWKKLHIFKEPYVNDPIIDATVKTMRKLVASTTMWFNIPANLINVFMGNYNNWRAENIETLAKGNARLFGGKGSRKEVGVISDYALAIIKKYNLVNQDFDSHPVIKANSIFSKLATWGTQVGEYQIQGSLALGLLNQEEFDSFEFTKDKYGNDVLTVKSNGKYTEDEIKSKMTQVKNRVTDIQGKYPDEDRRNIMRGEFGKALFQFKVWMPDWFKERFSARYINAYGVEKEGSYTKMLRVGVKEMYSDLKKGDVKKALTNPSFVTNLKGMATIGALLALKHSGDDDDEKKKGGLNWDSALSQVLFIFDLEQDKYMVSNPAAVLGKIKDFINAFEALIGFEEDAWQKTKRVLPGNKAISFGENLIK